MLTAHRPGDEEIDVKPPPLAVRPIVMAVIRRTMPRVIEATLIPALIFNLLLAMANGWVAIGGVAIWSYGIVIWRIVSHKPVPGLLLLATSGMTVRTVVALCARSQFTYFAQPILTTVVVALLFLASLVFGRPIIARMAHDFCPLDPEVAKRPNVVRLLSRLTAFWAAINFASAAATLGLLLSLPLGVFVPVKTVISLMITCLGIVATVAWSLRIARQENLTFGYAATLAD